MEMTEREHAETRVDSFFSSFCFGHFTALINYLKKKYRGFDIYLPELVNNCSCICKMASTEGFAAALDTTTSIFPYFCSKPKC